MPTNTGYKGYTNLEYVYLDNGESLGITKTNSIIDPDYIAPVYDPSYCPLPSASPSVTPTVTRTPSVTPSITVTSTPSSTIPATLSVIPTVTQTPSVTPSIGLSPSVTPTVTPSVTSSPPTLYTVTVFGYNDDLTTTITYTKVQWSTGSNTGPWFDFPGSYLNTLEQRNNFMGSAQFTAGSNVYVRVINNLSSQCKLNISNNSTNPTTPGTACSESIANISNSATRAFYITAAGGGC